MKILYILILTVLISCNKKSSESNNKPESFLLITDINPGFLEPSEITIEMNDTVRKATILIVISPRGKFYNSNSTSKLDTFYYKSILLTEKLASQLKSEIITKLESTIKSDSTSGFDGISISYIFNHNDKLSYYSLWSPNSIKNPNALILTQDLVDNTKLIFNDTIITEYLDDVGSYLYKPKKNHSTDRKIDKLRKKTVANN
jgi:hypothetical protein